MRQLRQLHHYVGVFFAPAIILFALSGALQTFRLQEEKGYGATPPGWIVWMASVHKDQALPRPEKAKADPGPKQEGAAASAKPKAQTAAKRPFTLPLKIFVALLSAGLMLSTILGVVIALNNRAMRRISIAMLVIGSVLPLMLLLV